MSWVSTRNSWEQDSRTASQGNSPSQAAQQNADDVIPVEKLDGPARSQLDGVCPGSPADHAEQHEGELGGISFGQERDKTSLSDALAGRAAQLLGAALPVAALVCCCAATSRRRFGWRL